MPDDLRAEAPLAARARARAESVAAAASPTPRRRRGGSVRWLLTLLGVAGLGVAVAA
jgi:hypothetical protein